MVKVKDLTSYLESIAPAPYQESYDNSGLLTGNPDMEVRGVLITLDTTEEVIKEALASNCNVIISHHPIIFKGLKKLTGSNYVERTVILAIKNEIAIYAIHTNLDNIKVGVNKKICEVLKLNNPQILSPKKQLLKKLSVFVPKENTENVLKALHQAGAGDLGNYSECSFLVEGTGRFKANERANPTIGKANETEFVVEDKVEVIFPEYLESKITKALCASHPYEEPAFDIYLLENSNKEVGSGMVGELENPMKEEDFLKYIKEKMNLSVLKHTLLLGKEVKRVAVCGGSGSFLLRDAINSGAQAFITSDFKYHEYFDAENKIIITDIGHYESEVFTKDLILEFLNKKFANIALVLSKTVTNPIRYI